MKIVIITGLSGSGKSEAMDVMEDMGFYCVDNLPPSLISKFITLGLQSGNQLEKVAFGIDIRGYQFFEDLYQALEFIKESNIDYKVIFLEADDSILVRRYKMTRRKHPLSQGEDTLEVIKKERHMLEELRNKSDYIIDTTNFLPIDLRNKILSIFFSENKSKIQMTISIVSFGFKHGIPIDSDLVFDVRFMPNPYYVDSLKEKTGNDIEVNNYVMHTQESKDFYKKLIEFIKMLLPKYNKEGKNHLVISIGCTGGKHRSVTISNMIYNDLKKDNYDVFIKHRDIKK